MVIIARSIACAIPTKNNDNNNAIFCIYMYIYILHTHTRAHETRNLGTLNTREHIQVKGGITYLFIVDRGVASYRYKETIHVYQKIYIYFEKHQNL